MKVKTATRNYSHYPFWIESNGEQISKVDNDIIINACLAEYGYTLKELHEKTRYRDRVECRNSIALLLAMKPTNTDKVIGEIINRDRSTVIYAFNKFPDDINSDHELSQRMMRILNKLEAFFARKSAQLVGKVTGLDQDDVVKIFRKAEKSVMQMGFIPINPISLVGDPEAQYSRAMHLCINSIFEVSAIALIPGWVDSPGARAEYHLAMALGHQIIEL